MIIRYYMSRFRTSTATLKSGEITIKLDISEALFIFNQWQLR